MSAVTEERAVAAASATGRPVGGEIRVLGPARTGPLGPLRDVWRYRSLFGHLGKIFVMRRLRRTYLAQLWIPLRPLVDVASKAFFFGGALQATAGDRPYFIYIAFGMAAWQLFDRTMHWSTRAIRMGNAVAGNLPFPRLPVLIAGAVPSLVDFVLYLSVAMISIVYFMVVTGTNYFVVSITHWLVAVLGLVLLIAYAVAVGLFTAPIAGVTKEVRYFQAYVSQFWFFITPIAYVGTNVPTTIQPLIDWNPLTAPIMWFQYGILGTSGPSMTSVGSCLVTLPLLLLGGLVFFGRFERAALARR